ncbi:MAG: NYN domain-containing protein [Kiritimatiellia bacterium]|jgi:predicted RNA-binding protein with PIN domain
MTKWIIIDGYNLLYRQDGGNDIAARRSALIRLLEQSAGTLTPRITLVFDGALHSAMIEPCKTFVEETFTPAGMSADATIEAMITADPCPSNILVVTSDRMIADAAAAVGTETMSCSAFLNTLDDAHKNISSHIMRLAASSRGPSLGEFFP